MALRYSGVPLYWNCSIKYIVQVLVASFAGKFACIHSPICPFKGWGKVTWVGLDLVKISTKRYKSKWCSKKISMEFKYL